VQRKKRKERLQRKKRKEKLQRKRRKMEKAPDAKQKPKIPKRRRFEDAGDASQEIYDSFNIWGAILTKHSIEATFAIIAANWAVHSNLQELLNNTAAKISLGLAIGFLGLNLFGTGIMTCLLGKRCTYADDDKERWEKEFRAAGANSKSPWPYTCCIERLGSILRFLKMWMPVISAGFFIGSLF